MRAVVHGAVALVVFFIAWLWSGSRNDHLNPPPAPIVRFVANHPWFTAAAAAGALGLGAALMVVSGVVPIKASSGHWWITARFLDFAKMQSVRTHSLGIQPPPLEEEAHAIRGAAHYMIGCELCHGGPDSGVPPVAAAMTPPPPELTGEGLSRFTSEQLFSIVKHGIKFTGMPGWPVQRRDDEVWAIVAFLRRMPNLDSAEYRTLASGDAGTSPDAAPHLPPAEAAAPPRAVRDLCWRCHGVDGTGRGPGAFPSLAGQRAPYLYASLRAFADRTRLSGTMNQVAAGLSDSAMREVAIYYEGLPGRAAEAPADSAATIRGASISIQGVPDRDIPACAECHGPSDLPKNPAYPALASQHAPYLRLQLELLQQRRRGGSPSVNLMHVFVDRLRPEHIQDVTMYYAATSPRR